MLDQEVNPQLAVVVPVYRNGSTLAELRDRLDSALERTWVMRLVVDACPEQGASMATELASGDPRVHVTLLPRNVGQHRAIVVGLAAESQAQTWVCMDGDLQDRPEAIPSLLEGLEQLPVAGMFAGRAGAYEARGRRLGGVAHRRLLSLLTGLPADAGAFFAMDPRLREAVIEGVQHRRAPSVVVAAGRSGLPLASSPVIRDARSVGTSSWTSSARAKQSVVTLVWAMRHLAVRA